MKWALASLMLVGCVAPPPAPLTDFPEVDALPEQTGLPALFASFNSQHVVQTSAEWNEWRRAQLIALFDHYVYGARPALTEVTARQTANWDDVVPGARWEEWDLTLGGDADAVLHLAVVTPSQRATPAPVIVGVNKCGNQSLVADARVRLTTSVVIPACGPGAEETRGVQAALWPLERIVARGFAVVTFHESDAAPDDDEKFATMLRARFRPPAGQPPRASWGTLALWAWALAHVGAWVDAQPGFDATRTAVFGHSRRGKAALLSGVMGTSFDAVVAHQSGTGGAALNRSFEGETIELINLTFPHWFDDVYPGFSNAEVRTPVDQHQLLALWAPRRVVLVDGDDDRWADPEGARGAAEAASPAWQLFGKAGFGAELTWQSRPGVHAVEPTDWELFLDALGW